MKNLKYLQKLFFLLVMGFSLSFVCAACGDDEEDEPIQDPNQEQTDNGGAGSGDNGGAGSEDCADPSQNTTDIAVTGLVTSLGHTHAVITGYANLNLLVGSGTPQLGVELLASGSDASPRQETSSELVGRCFTATFQKLLPSTDYRYRSFVKYGGNTYYGEYKSFTTEKFEQEASIAVDLGLPSGLKWASVNVGASSPEEYGDYFAWGETTTKSSYYYDNSVTYLLSTSELKSRGIIGFDGNLTAAYDAATANWGGSWRMPTSDEIEELKYNCTWTWTTHNGVNGRKVTGPNGNSIFLPAAGNRNGTDLNNAGSSGYYWSASPHSGGSSACRLYFGSVNYDCYLRRFGFTVRPVSE